jgi:SecD/SecF fusion protein
LQIRIFGNTNLTEIKFNTPDDQVKNIIRRKIDASVGTAYEVLRTRIDKMGVTQPNVQSSWYRKNSVEMPGIKDIDRVKKMLATSANFSFGKYRWDRKFYLISELSQLVKAKEIL